MTAEVLLGLVPILLVFLPLVVGRYIGADRLQRIAVRRRVQGSPRRATRIQPWRAADLTVTHGGLLLARRLAGRAPPRAQLAL